MSGRTLWYIVTPIYWPAAGGAAVYSKMLAEALAEDGADVIVATEAFPNTERLERKCLGSGSLVIDRLFPLRAGRAEFGWRTYTAYAWANILLLGLPGRLARAVREAGADRVVVLVHASVFTNPSLMPLVLERMRRLLPEGARLVADVRDLRFGDSLGPILAHFDVAISCSRIAAKRVRSLSPQGVDVVHIPIPFELATPPDDEEVAAVLAKHSLRDIPYVLNPNGIRESKRYPEMLAVVRELRRIPGYEDTVLVTIGPARNWKARDDAAVAEGLLKYAGTVPHRSGMALMKGAKATLILSLIEGMPRSALESLALKTPAVVPPIAEFLEYIPASVVQSDDPSDIARHIIRVSEQPAGEGYPLEAHSMTSIIAAYRALEPCVSARPGD